jgi:peptidoglycan-associated lipoprotein
MNPGGEFTAGGPTDLTPRTTDGMDAAALGAGRGILESVFFDFDRAEVRASERPKLEKAATYLKENAQARVLLEGSCDWRGTTEYNLGLGDRRAQSVKVYLQNLGIAADRFDVLSKGDTEAKEGATDAEMAKDRRVEFVVIGLP